MLRGRTSSTSRSPCACTCVRWVCVWWRVCHSLALTAAREATAIQLPMNTENKMLQGSITLQVRRCAGCAPPRAHCSNAGGPHCRYATDRQLPSGAPIQSHRSHRVGRYMLHVMSVGTCLHVMSVGTCLRSRLGTSLVHSALARRCRSCTSNLCHPQIKQQSPWVLEQLMTVRTLLEVVVTQPHALPLTTVLARMRSSRCRRQTNRRRRLPRWCR